MMSSWTRDENMQVPPCPLPWQRLVMLVAVIVTLAGGCIDLQLALQGAIQDLAGEPPPTDGQNEGSEPSVDGSVPAVTLRVSNPSPQLNEEVLLTCSIISGDTAGVTFDFQPADGRLFVDHQAGTATFIVEQADSGAAFTFTCTATNQNGTSEPSDEQVIIPTFQSTSEQP